MELSPGFSGRRAEPAVCFPQRVLRRETALHEGVDAARNQRVELGVELGVNVDARAERQPEQAPYAGPDLEAHALRLFWC